MQQSIQESTQHSIQQSIKQPIQKGHCGLALSGGGFRASLFHLGVLARLAELNKLRDIESISTVSGGSIVGAAYYLHLKHLLESTPDKAITHAHYLSLVEKLIAGFGHAIKANLRIKTFANPYHNMKMVLPWYSRSDRIGELYDEYLYRHIIDPQRTTPMYIHELKIYPLDDPHGEEFNPTRGHNDTRINKVPIINFNATVLNTGHNWRFTASEMGEVINKHPLAENIDKNTRLVSGRYHNICKRNEGFKLGKAVAASAGVPGLFPPLAVSNMFDWTVQLVDGGVYDNQGVESLLHGDVRCDKILISDAAGQMRDAPESDAGLFAVLSRATSIMMDRVREEVIRDAEKNADIVLMHLTQGLPIRYKDYRKADCENVNSPRTPVEDPVPNIDPDMRGRISRIRTDLDAFTDVESYCIMAHGYTLAEALIDAEQAEEKSHTWAFSHAIDWIRIDSQTKPAHLERSLDAAEKTFGKVFKLGFSLDLAQAVALFVGGLAVYVLALYFLIDLFVENPWNSGMTWLEETTALDVLGMVGVLVAIKLTDILGRTFKKLNQLRKIYNTAVILVIRFILPAVGAIPVWLYLYTLSAFYVKQGEVK